MATSLGRPGFKHPFQQNIVYDWHIWQCYKWIWIQFNWITVSSSVHLPTSLNWSESSPGHAEKDGGIRTLPTHSWWASSRNYRCFKCQGWVKMCWYMSKSCLCIVRCLMMFFCISSISYQSMNFCILTSMCFGSLAVHRKETNGTSLKNFNQLCHVSCQKCQLDQEYARQDSFLPNLPWHGTDYNMINWFSATDISGFWTWPFFPCWPWGWRIPMNDQALDRIGMSDRFDGFSCVSLCFVHVFFMFDLLDGFCCVYILSSISNSVRRKILDS